MEKTSSDLKTHYLGAKKVDFSERQNDETSEVRKPISKKIALNLVSALEITREFSDSAAFLTH
jgi:hypothetical protein